MSEAQRQAASSAAHEPESVEARHERAQASCRGMTAEKRAGRVAFAEGVMAAEAVGRDAAGSRGGRAKGRSCGRSRAATEKGPKGERQDIGVTVSVSGSKRSASFLVVLVSEQRRFRRSTTKGLRENKGKRLVAPRLVPETKEHREACCT